MKAILLLLVFTSLVAQYPQSGHSKLNPELLRILQKAEEQKTSGPVLSNRVPEKHSVIVYTDHPQILKAAGIKVNSELPGFVTAQLTLKEIQQLSSKDEVKFITTGEVNYIHNDIASAMVGANLLHSGYVNSTPYEGSGVLVCIIDTGIDWDHPDFRDPADQSQSRIVAIWDQTLTRTGAETSPSAPLNYGVEYSKEQIEDELDGNPAGFVREADLNGHGTHVAGTAAGNGYSGLYKGMAPQADILVVKAGNASFSSANIVNALTWANNKAAALGKPIVVNMSLGSDGGSHDGTDEKSIAINNFTGEGKVVVVSAGNSGASLIHKSGTIPALGTSTLEIVVPAYSASAGSGNDYFSLDTWMDNNPDVSVTVTTPGGFTAWQPISGHGNQLTSLPAGADGAVYLYNWIVLQNMDRQIYLDIFDSDAARPPAAGTWRITFTNNTGSPVDFHTWLSSKSPSLANVTFTGANSDYTLGNTAAEAIIVGSYAHRWFWNSAAGSQYYGVSYAESNISSFSSKGPTRDDIQKPDICAPGQAILSCRSSNASYYDNTIISDYYVKNQGTSMSSPVVAGCAALLLNQNSSMTADEVKNLLISTAETDGYTGSALPDYTWGYGKLSIYKAMVQLIQSGFENDWDVLGYDTWSGITEANLSENVKASVKFTPSYNGKIAGVFFHVGFTNSLTSPVYAEVWSDNSGLPSAKLGNTVSLEQSKVNTLGWNHIDMTASGVSVTAGTDYHLVLYYTSGSLSLLTDAGTVDNRSSTIPPSGSWSAYTNDYRIRTIVTKDISALPVELVSFEALNKNKYVVLNWATATEVNCYGFDIERKEQNESKWIKVGFVNGSGNSNSVKRYSFKDADIKCGTYNYRLREIDNDGKSEYSPETTVWFTNLREFALEQNFPNPFNPATVISYQLPVACNVSLKVFDVLGKEVTQLESSFKEAGAYRLEFNGQNLAAGIYLYQLRAGDFTSVKKFILQK